MEKQVSAHWSESWVCWPLSRICHTMLFPVIRSFCNQNTAFPVHAAKSPWIENLDMGNPLRAVKSMVLALALLEWRDRRSRHSTRLVQNRGIMALVIRRESPWIIWGGIYSPPLAENLHPFAQKNCSYFQTFWHWRCSSWSKQLPGPLRRGQRVIGVFGKCCTW
jgi:hypothetical protein